MVGSLTVAPPASAQQHLGERDLGLAAAIGGDPGPLDAITNVAGVEVGTRTLISGEGKLVVGQGPVRTGVTMIFPRGRDNIDPVFANWYSYNGNGGMTGTTWIREGGFLEGPIGITNTHSVGIVRDAIIPMGDSPGPPHDPAVAAAGCRRDVRRWHERHQRLPRHVRDGLSGDRQRTGRGRAGGRERRWWHRHDVLRLQGQYWHGLAEAPRQPGRLHGRDPRPVQHRRTPRAADWWCPCGTRARRYPPRVHGHAGHRDPSRASATAVRGSKCPANGPRCSPSAATATPASWRKGRAR